MEKQLFRVRFLSTGIIYSLEHKGFSLDQAKQHVEKQRTAAERQHIDTPEMEIVVRDPGTLQWMRYRE